MLYFICADISSSLRNLRLVDLLSTLVHMALRRVFYRVSMSLFCLSHSFVYLLYFCPS